MAKKFCFYRQFPFFKYHDGLSHFQRPHYCTIIFNITIRPYIVIFVYDTVLLLGYYIIIVSYYYIVMYILATLCGIYAASKCNASQNTDTIQTYYITTLMGHRIMMTTVRAQLKVHELGKFSGVITPVLGLKKTFLLLFSEGVVQRYA